ncbi:hypothetical protein HU200_032562 [Digitaria exilis]|uniref:K Homology domain-containing protein n=2 Tax=Magnoliopsida TaxID=3398 RepID=A0A835ES03_9POAL|nr:hypothetical protein HU200_032562 [Digitaria exilis]
MRDLNLSLNQTQRVRLEAALHELQSLVPAAASAAAVTVADTIPVNQEDNILKYISLSQENTIKEDTISLFVCADGLVWCRGHGTSDQDGEVVATLCGVVERVNKLVYVRTLRARYKPEVGDIIVGRVIERRRTAVDELNMRSIFVENDVICVSTILALSVEVDNCFIFCFSDFKSVFAYVVVLTHADTLRVINHQAEVRGFQHDGSLHLQARSEKYGKVHASSATLPVTFNVQFPTSLDITGYATVPLYHYQSVPFYASNLAFMNCKNVLLQLERGQLLTVPPYLVKRKKQHFHHLAQYDVDLILGCNGFIWVGEHVLVGENVKTTEDQQKYEADNFTPLETRKHICRLANAIRVLSALGFTLTVELIIETAEASVSSNVEVNDMLGAEFYVQTAEREAKRRAALLRKKNGGR